MKTTLLMTLLLGLIFLTTVGAAGKTLTPQQQRMTTRNQQATAQTLKGDVCRAYISDRLKNSKSAPEEKSLTPQQQKVYGCNVKATGQSLKSDDRSKSMSTRLKKSAQYFRVSRQNRLSEISYFRHQAPSYNLGNLFQNIPKYDE